MIKNLLLRTLSSLLILPFSLFFIIKGGNIFILFLIFCMIISIIEWVKITNKKNIQFLGVLFIFFSFFSTYQIRYELENDQSLVFFLLIFFICISTDVGGYIFGNIFKGPKITKISPNKTYAGAIGGFLFSLFVSYFMITFIDFFNTPDLIFNLSLISFILLISLVSQLGDIIISFFKRISNVKDTGKLIPGHGGILDRIDGMIFVYPLVFLVKFLY